MPGRVGIALLLLAAMAPGASAQQAPDPASLNDTERLGQKLFYQSCGVCHQAADHVAAVRPGLSKASAGGRKMCCARLIANGSPRMPGFKHHFDSSQIAAIVAYLKIPEPPAAPAGAPPR